MVSNVSTKTITVLDNDMYTINDVCEAILSEVRENKYDSKSLFAIHLALEEAIVNALKHGNKFDSSKKVDVSYHITESKCDISVTDEGCGFDPDSLPDPRAEENLYKPSGRGVLLIRSYMDVVEFNKIGNSVHMVKLNKSQS